MKRLHNSILLGLACIGILLWGMWLGYTLAPSPLAVSHETFHEVFSQESFQILYELNDTSILLFMLGISTNMTLLIRVYPNISHEFIIVNNQGQGAAGDFDILRWPLTPSTYFINHTFYDTCQVEYFLY